MNTTFPKFFKLISQDVIDNSGSTGNIEIPMVSSGFDLSTTDIPDIVKIAPLTFSAFGRYPSKSKREEIYKNLFIKENKENTFFHKIIEKYIQPKDIKNINYFIN